MSECLTIKKMINYFQILNEMWMTLFSITLHTRGKMIVSIWAPLCFFKIFWSTTYYNGWCSTTYT